MIKLIAVDLDGTLLRTDKSISVYTKHTISACRKKGVKVICATGRGRDAEVLAPPDMFDGRIMMNGAVAYAGETLLYHRPVAMDTARDFSVACDAYGLKAAAETGATHYANFNVADEWSYIQNYRIVDLRRHDVDAEKIYAIVRNEAGVAFLQRHIPSGLHLTVSRDHLAQVMHTEATKMKAILALADHWDIQREGIVSFGDDLNDLDMLSQCGTGVAMGNAVEEVKEAADEVCETNDDDGVAKWIEKCIL